MEAVLLAGGLGTRLHGVTGDRYPKSLAEVDGRPFLHYVIEYLASMGVDRFVIAVSHHAQQIVDSLGQRFPDLDVVYSHETEPMGTGGAIKQAMEYCQGDSVLVVNADSFMQFELADFCAFAEQHQAGLAILCTEVDDVSRFGAADIDEQGRLRGFFEKGRQGKGYINSGVYLIRSPHPRLQALSGRFSFEHEVLAASEVEVYASRAKGLFFDIGTPDDYAGAQALVNLNRTLFRG